jgi:hypothetical protein
MLWEGMDSIDSLHQVEDQILHLVFMDTVFALTQPDFYESSSTPLQYCTRDDIIITGKYALTLLQ